MLREAVAGKWRGVALGVLAGVCGVGVGWWQEKGAVGVGPRVYWVAGEGAGGAGGADGNDGTEGHPFKTISRGAEVAQPGDTVMVHGGVYRERVTPARGGTEGHPITYRAVEGEVVCVRGSEVWNPPWAAVAGNSGVSGVYEGKLEKGFVGREVFCDAMENGRKGVAEPVRPCAPDGPWAVTLGDLYVDGVPYLQVTGLEGVNQGSGTWAVLPDGETIRVHFLAGLSPERRRVELAVRPRLLAPHRRGLEYIQVIGFTFEQAANRAGWIDAGAAVSTRSGKHWLFEGNTIRFAKATGLDVGSETWLVDGLSDTDEADRRIMLGGENVVRHNVVSDCGLCGITAWNAHGIEVVDNVVERNARLDFQRPAEASAERAGIKLLGMSDALVRGNLVRDNAAFGIWMDNGFKNCRITRNVVANNQEAGVFMELDDSPALIDTNVIVQNQGEGIYAHDTANLTVAHNLILENRHFGVWFHLASARDIKRKDHTVRAHCTGMMVLNNVIAGNGTGAISMPADGKLTGDNMSDYNVYGGPRGWWHGAEGVFFMVNQGLGTAKPAEFENAALRATGEVNAAGERLVGLEQWRTATGRDKHSEVVSASKRVATWRPEVLELMLNMRPEELPLTEAPAMEGVTEDFGGKAMGEHPAPGPWQKGCAKEIILR